MIVTRAHLLLTFAEALISIVHAHAIELVPSDVKECSSTLRIHIQGKLPLECAEFASNDGDLRADTSPEPDVCNSCLEGSVTPGIRRLNATLHIEQCLLIPAVFYKLSRKRSGTSQQSLAVCARPACPIGHVVRCSGAARVQMAMYWAALAVLVPWSVYIDSFRQTAVPPGVPPFGTFECIGPPKHFYQEPAALPSLPKPHECGQHVFHPISFGIPEEDMVPCLPQKLDDFASLIPGQMDTYIFPMTSFGELEYKRMYRNARFALSPRKSGWETMRLYEILAW